MFIEFILKVIENIMLAYFISDFLSLENQKDYIFKNSFFRNYSFKRFFI